MSMLLKRMVGAARLDGSYYEQVEADRTSMAGAVFTAVVASVAAAVGMGARDASEILGATLALLATWMVWVGLTYAIGTQLLPQSTTQSSLEEVVRTTGYSASPGILRILAIIPSIALPVFIAVTFWMLFAFVVAIRHTMDYTSFPRAFAVCFLGWLVYGILFFGFVIVAV